MHFPISYGFLPYYSGAVTSPTVLPPGGSTSLHGIGAPGSSRSDIKISQNLSAAENGCTLFFEKDKHQNESCVDLEDCEAEAEAAASAVAAAAISSDEIVGNGLGPCSVSVSDSKSFTGADVDGIGGGDILLNCFLIFLGNVKDNNFVSFLSKRPKHFCVIRDKCNNSGILKLRCLHRHLLYLPKHIEIQGTPCNFKVLSTSNRNIQQ